MNEFIRFLVSSKPGGWGERIKEDVREKEDVIKGREGKPAGYKTISSGVINLVGWQQ